MKKRTITSMCIALTAFALGTQQLKAQTVDPPGSLPETPLYNETYVKPLFSEAYTGSATIQKLTPSSGGIGSQVTILEDNMVKFTTSLNGWSFIEFNETINIEDYDYLCFDVYVVEANFFIKVRFNEASTPPGTDYVKAGGTAQQGKWTRVKVNLTDYYNAVTKTKPTYNNITKVSFINNGGQARTVYIDNIYAYKSTSLPSLTNIAKSNTDLILAGPWSETEFNHLDNGNITSIDLADILNQNSKPTTTNPNCLIYTNNATLTGTNVISNGMANDITIQEGFPFNNPRAFTASRISYSRTYDSIGWGSLCLPYTIESLPDGLTAYTLSGTSGTAVTFQPATSIAANTPYIVEIKTAGAKDFSLAEGEFAMPATHIVSLGEENLRFKGTFTPISGENKYLLNKNGNGFAYGAAAATIPSFRAYIEDETGTEPLKLALKFNNGGATAINPQQATQRLSFFSANGRLIIRSDQPRQLKVFAIDGRAIYSLAINEGDNLITHLPKGIYIIGGQKVIVN